MSRAEVVVRARRIQGGAGDTVVKQSPVIPDQLSEGLRNKKRFGVEVDAMPRGFVWSASMKGKATAVSVWDVLEGSGVLRDLLSSSQRGFYEAHTLNGLKLRDLVPLGLITLLKLRWERAGFDRGTVVEFCPYADGSRILEISTRCLPHEAFDVAVRTRAFLRRKGIDLSGEQHTKTKTALEYFASGGTEV